jgi:hypothetical protein
LEAASVSFLSASRSIFSWVMRRSSSSISSGFESISIRIRLAASSIRSIALSGRWRSVMYLLDKVAAATIALSVMRTPWWTSYFSFSPRRIEIVSSTVRLVDEDRLEAPRQRGVLLDIFAVLVERGRADAMELAARERWLEHVRRIHCAFGLACADERMQLIDEQDDIGCRLQHGFEAFLEFTTVFCSREQRAEVEGEQASALERLRHVAFHDALCQTLDDGGLADAGLADQNGIILRPA